MVFLGLSGTKLGKRQNLILCLIASIFLLSGFYSYAHGEEEKSFSRKEAYQASGEWNLETFEVKNPKIVLHYGEGIKFAENLAQVLSEKGYPTVAYLGGPDKLIEVIVGRVILKGKFDQRDLNRGTIGGTATRMYDLRFAKPSTPEDQAISHSSFD